MKFATSTVLAASAIVATAAASPQVAPASGKTYNIKVTSLNGNQALENSLVTVKDEAATNQLNPIGVWSTGEPRYAYSLTFSPSPDNNLMGELKNTVKSNHLILNGPDPAKWLYDVPIGADPPSTKDKPTFTNQFTQVNKTQQLVFGQRWKKGGDPTDLVGAGTWRACKGDVTGDFPDYQLLWFDGLSRLEDYAKGCETVELWLVEAKGTSTPGGPSSAITGVPAPSTTGSWISGVPAPTGIAAKGNGSSISVPPFTGAASRLGMASAMMGVAIGAMAFIL